ncbi:MAG TPA: hypothetical protein VMU42_15935, partial [Candidatus Sulfotelmatobacter sp.]|nr:hypothetical protein [Candidatus Sulfotelmatobacter sp.]
MDKFLLCSYISIGRLDRLSFEGAAMPEAGESPRQFPSRAGLPRAPHLEALLARCLCDIAAYLLAIHRQPLTFEDRFLILWPQQRPAFYAQCCLDDGDRAARCECVSAAFNAEMAATPARLAALAALGYDTDGSVDNYRQ